MSDAGDDEGPAGAEDDAALLAEGAALLTRAAVLLAGGEAASAAAQGAVDSGGPAALPKLVAYCTYWTSLSLPLRIAALLATLSLLAVGTYFGGARAGNLQPQRGAPPELVRAASQAWSSGEWGRAQPGETPVLAQEDFVFLGTAEAYHNFSRGCGTAQDREGVLGLRWRPHPRPGVPAFPRWSRGETCAALRGSDVVVVGDSLSGEFFDTLVSALAHRADYGNVPRLRRCWKRRICGAPGERPSYAYYINVMKFVTLDRFGNEFTHLDGTGDGEDAANTPGGQPCLPPPAELEDHSMGRLSWEQQLAIVLGLEAQQQSATPAAAAPAAAAAATPTAPPPQPVLIVNTGAHYYGDDPGAEQTVWDFFQYARLLAPSAAHFYRTTPPGHPGCELRRWDPPLPTPLPEALFHTPLLESYMWWRFTNFTARIVAGLPGDVVVVDVDAATSRRIDSHPYRDNLAGVAGMGVDCLHYCIPGPIDLWVELWAALLRLQRVGVDALERPAPRGML